MSEPTDRVEKETAIQAEFALPGASKLPPEAAFLGTASNIGDLRDTAKEIYQALLMSISWN